MEKAASVAEEACGDWASPEQARVHRCCPSLSAQNQSCVVAPFIVGSNICNLNISVASADPGSTFSSKETPNKNAETFLQAQKKTSTACQQELKEVFKRRFRYLEAALAEAQKTPLHEVYTELFITLGGNGGVNQEHEVRQMEASSRLDAALDRSVRCSQLFVPAEGREPPRSVLTRGVAGVGKTVSVHKFALDWAEDRDSTGLEFVFPLSFRELNLMKTKTLSLEELLAVFFPQTRDAGVLRRPCDGTLFILDGLDESRLSLDFHSAEILTEVTEEASVEALLVNLLRGRLLPRALVWVTSRPVASGQIPSRHVDLLTEIRGFSDPQKDEYFKRTIRDRVLAERVLAHVQACRSLHIMCHLPLFCRMAASVLQEKLSTEDSEDTPRSLTQMYIHFLSLYVDDMKTRLPGGGTSTARDTLLALGGLAFRELERGHLVFYEDDLERSGIRITQASRFSGFYTQIFSEEVVLCGDRVFCFVHLSVQEFLAALFVFLKFHNEGVDVLSGRTSSSRRLPFRDAPELLLYRRAVDKALRSPEGCYDLFLRFLLGLSLASNRTLLGPLVRTKSQDGRRQTRAPIIELIKRRIRTSPSPDRCVNLFHCLEELEDASLVDELQGFVQSGPLSASHWNTLLVLLLASQDHLSVFQLSRYARSEEGLLRLLPLVRTAREARLDGCRLTEDCCGRLSSTVGTSRLRDLDLSNNGLGDAGMRALWRGLRDARLDTLRLRSCGLTGDSSRLLAATVSGSSTLRLLDLSDNELGDAGVQQLCGELESPGCKLDTLLLSLCGLTDLSCRVLASALGSSRLRDLDLSYNHLGDAGLDLLAALLQHPQRSLQKVSVDHCGESRIRAAPLKYSTTLTLDPNTAQADLVLSGGNRKARRWTKQARPDHPDRFQFWRQVMSVEGLSGRSYWEVEWSGRAFVGAAYRSMSREGEGEASRLGRNRASWGVSCSAGGCRAWHDGLSTVLSPTPSPTLGVFLDWSAGTLAFYTVADGDRTLLHTFRATFSEPVHAAFRLGWVESSVALGPP